MSEKIFWLNVKIVKVGFVYEKVVAVCDKELLGKKFEEGDLQLYVNPTFYGGKLASEEEVIEALEGATIVNLVGEKAVNLGIKLGIIDPKRVIRIQGVPHAQMVVVF